MSKALAWYTEQSVFPKKLRSLMEENHTTQEQLAKYLGVARQSVSQYANGQTVPSIYTAQKIANYYNIDVGFLLSENFAVALYDSTQLKELCMNLGGERFYNAVMGLLTLNAKGMDKAIERIEELCELPKYSAAYDEYRANSKDL